MTTQLRYNFQASPAVHGADDITAPHLWSQVNAVNMCGPRVDTLIDNRRLECPNLTLVHCGSFQASD